MSRVAAGSLIDIYTECDVGRVDPTSGAGWLSEQVSSERVLGIVGHVCELALMMLGIFAGRTCGRLCVSGCAGG